MLVRSGRYGDWEKVRKEKIYIFLILTLAAPSRLILGYYGNGGVTSRISLFLQAIPWFSFALTAFLHIKTGNIRAHQNFRILSYALKLSAITLRLFRWIISNTLELPPMDAYRLVVWLGWIFNLGVASIIIGQQKNS